MKIYIKGPKPKSIKELLIRLHKGLWGGSYYYGNPTYSDPQCTKVHCLDRKTRSLDDTIYLCKTYFKASTKRIIHEIIMLDLRHPKEYERRLYPHLAYCNDIRRVTILYYRLPLSVYLDTKLDSMYSWREALALIGIKDPVIDDATIRDYINKHTKIKRKLQ